MTIKHLVISGGGIHGFTYWGIIRECLKANVVNYDNLETITSVSIGGFIAAIIALKYDCDTLDDYFIKRPWHEAIPMGIYEYINSIEKCGIFDRTILINILKPVFGGKDIDIDVTLKQFYEITNIKNNFLCTNACTLEPVLMNYENFPDVKLIDVIYCSASIPVIFCPLKIHDVHYIDGGFNANYPIDFLIDSCEDIDADEILGIFNNNVNKSIEYTNLLSYVSTWLSVILKNCIERTVVNRVKYEITLDLSVTEGFDFASLLNCEDTRKIFIDRGVEPAKNLINMYNGEPDLSSERTSDEETTIPH